MLSIISRLRKTLFLSLAALTLSVAPISASAGVGGELQNSPDKELFKFFGLQPEAVAKEEARLVLRPSGEYLSEVTQLRVRIGEDGKVERMELWMESSFMKDEWVTSYDLAAWFLGASVPDEAADDVKLFRLELEYPQDKDIYYKNVNIPEEVPTKATRAYQAFKGEAPNYEQPLGDVTFRIEKTEIAGKSWTRMIVTAKNESPTLSQLSGGSKYKI